MNEKCRLLNLRAAAAPQDINSLLMPLHAQDMAWSAARRRLPGAYNAQLHAIRRGDVRGET